MLITRSYRSNCKFNPKISFNRGLIAQTGFIPEGAQLLQDSYSLKLVDSKKVLAEGFNGKKRNLTKITGLFQIAEAENANGRVYTRPVIAEAVQAIQDDIANHSVWGEYDHPSDAKIHLERVSHKISKIWMEGDRVYGEAFILEDMPFGAQLKILLENGTIGISSRGIGDMEVREANGQEVMYVLPGYRFVTWDAVAEPSVHGAILHICEGKLKPLKKVAQPLPDKNLFADKATSESVLVKSVDDFLASL